jgi:hypothetical protein
MTAFSMRFETLHHPAADRPETQMRLWKPSWPGPISTAKQSSRNYDAERFRFHHWSDSNYIIQSLARRPLPTAFRSWTRRST